MTTDAEKKETISTEGEAGEASGSSSPGRLQAPIGAVWVRDRRYRARLREVLGELLGTSGADPAVAEAEFKIAAQTKTLAVKVNALKEKFIAIENKSKSRATQPDFFLHVYQEYTGAAPNAPFRPYSATGTPQEEALPQVRQTSVWTPTATAVPGSEDS
jgi:hypothetical protein